MDNNALPRGIKKILFSRDEISNRIKELAHQIDEAFKDAKEPIILVGVLKGSFIFL